MRANSTFAKVTRDLGWASGGQILCAICGLSGLRLYTELLSRSEFGRAMMFAGALTLVDGLVIMALNQSLLPLCAERAQREGAQASDRLAARLAFWLLRRCAIALTPLAFLGIVVAVSTREALWLAPLFLLIYLGEEITKTAQTSSLAARRDYARLAIWQTGEALAGLMATALVLKFWRADAIGFLAGLLLSRLIVTASFSLAQNFKSLLRPATVAPERASLDAALAQGLPLAALAPLGWISNFFDRYAVMGVAGLGAGGLYVAAASLAARPYAIATAVLTQFFRPRLHGATDESRYKTLGHWLCAAAVLGLAGALLVAFWGDLIVNLALAPEFRADAKPILVALCLTQTCAIGCHALDNLLIARQSSAALLRAQAGGVGAALVLTPLGAFIGGGLGAALGRLLAESLKLAGVAVLVARRRAHTADHELLPVVGAPS